MTGSAAHRTLGKLITVFENIKHINNMFQRSKKKQQQPIHYGLVKDST